MNKDIGIEKKDVLKLLNCLFEKGITELVPIRSGNVKSVYFFKQNDTDYIINFSKNDIGIEQSNCLTELLLKNNIPTKRIIKSGFYKESYYTVSTKILGETLKTLNSNELNNIMPDLVEIITKVHLVDLGKSNGFGWIDNKGNGKYRSNKAFLEGFFSEYQDGYWKNWYDLFESTFLDREVFFDLYDEMIFLSKYCEGTRYLVHGDFHLGNIISKETQITGIIDWDNVMYGDFMFDIACMQMSLPEYKITDVFKDYYKTYNIKVPYFDERFKCMSLCRGLDSLRFFSKHGQKKSYDSVLSYLKSIMSV